ncbi:MAG: DUF6531 domain-containing protein [Planctomycetota bacterium]
MLASAQDPSTGVGPDGGIFRTSDGIELGIPADAFLESQDLSIRNVDASEIPLAVPRGFSMGAAVKIDAGPNDTLKPLALSINVDESIPVGGKIWIFEWAVTLDDEGTDVPLWSLVDSGTVEQGNVYRGGVGGWQGIRGSGVYLLAYGLPDQIVVSTAEVRHSLDPAERPVASALLVRDDPPNSTAEGEGLSINANAEGEVNPALRRVIHLNTLVQWTEYYATSPAVMYMFAPVADLIGFSLATVPVPVDSGVEMLNVRAYGSTSRSSTGVVFRNPGRPLAFVARANLNEVPQDPFLPKLIEAEADRINLSGSVEPIVRLTVRDLLNSNPAVSRTQNFSVSDFRIRFELGSSVVDAEPIVSRSSLSVNGESILVARVPVGTIVGSASVSAVRNDQRVERDPATGSIRLAPFDATSNSLNILPIRGTMVATDSDDGVILVGDSIARIPVGTSNGPKLSPRYTITSADGSRAYVSYIDGSQVGVVDMVAAQLHDLTPDDQTQAETLGIQSIELDPAGTLSANASAPGYLAMDPSGRYLFVADFIRPIIHVIDVDPFSPSFHQVLGRLRVDNPSLLTPIGLRGSAVTADGRSLVVASPNRNLFARNPPAGFPESQLIVFNVDPDSIRDHRSDDGSIADLDVHWKQIGVVSTREPGNFGNGGQESIDVVATDDPDLLLFTNRASDSVGFGTVRLNRGDGNAISPRLEYATGTCESRFVGSTLECGFSIGTRDGQFGVFSANHIAYLPADTLEDQIGPHEAFAFVTAFNRPNPNVAGQNQNYEPGIVLKPSSPTDRISNRIPGSNIALIRFPRFGGTPEVVAATRGIPFGFADTLTLSADGSRLFAAYPGIEADPIVDGGAAKGALMGFDVARMLTTFEQYKDEEVGLPNSLQRWPIDLIEPRINVNSDYNLECFDPPSSISPVCQTYAFSVPLLDPFNGQFPNPNGPIPIGNYIRGLSGPWTPNFESPPLTIDGEDPVRLTTRIENPNGHVCPVSSTLRFELNRRARVSLRIDGAIARDMPNPRDGGLTRLAEFIDIELPAGAYSIRLDPLGQLARPGEYTYTLEATNDDGETASDEGKILHEIESNGSLTVGHTLIKGVDLYDGHLVFGGQDAAIPGRVGLSFSRTYSSAGNASGGPLGAGWSHNYDVRLINDGCGSITVVGGDGSGSSFNPASGAADEVRAGWLGLQADAKFYEPEIGTFATLVQPAPDSDPGTFLFLTKTHTEYRFETDPRSTSNPPASRLVSITEPAGNSVRLIYDRGDARLPTLPEAVANHVDSNPQTLDAVIDESDRAFLLQYSASGSPRIIQLTGFDTTSGSLLDLEVNYDYDQDGNLIEVVRNGATPSDTRVESFTYTAGTGPDGHNLLSHTDPDGATTRYEYHNETTTGPLTPPGIDPSLGIEAFEFVARVIEPVGHTNLGGLATTEFVYDAPASDGTLRRTVSDVRGQREAIDETEFLLNSLGATERVTDAIGRVTTTLWCVGNTSLSHPACGATPAMLVAETTDPLGRRNEFRYDNRGNQIEKIIHLPPGMDDVIGAGGIPVTLISYQSTFDPIFNVETSITDPLGRTAYFQIDSPAPQPAGSPFAVSGGTSGKLLAQSDPSGAVSRFEYATSSVSGSTRIGDLTARIDAAGHTTTFSDYDASGKAGRVRTPNGSTETRVFDARGRLTESTVGFAARDHRRTQIVYDGLDRVIESTSFDRLGSAPAARESFEYSPGGDLLRHVSALGLVSVMTYDGGNRLLTRQLLGVLQPDGSSIDFPNETYVYNEAGQPVAQTDARGVTNELTYDEVGRLIQTRIAGGPHASTVGVGGVTSEFTYDDADNVITQTDRYGNVTTIAYDGLYHVTEMDLPFAGAEITSQYDAIGNLLSRTDASGQVTRFEYDERDQLVRQIEPLDFVMQYEYDSRGSVVVKESLRDGTLIGRTIYDDGIEIADSIGRATTTTETVFLGDPNFTGPVEYVTRVSYDDASATATSTNSRGTDTADPVGGRNRVQLNGFGRIESETVDLGGLNLTTRYQYDAGGNVIAIRDSQNSDTDTTRTFDALGRVIRSEGQLGTVTETEYDAIGNVVARTDALGVRIEYAYDNLNRMVEERLAGSGIAASVPNHVIMSYEFDDANRQTFMTDARGNTSRETRDRLGRVVERTDNLGNAWSFTYDAMDLLAETDPLGRETRFTYDDRHRVLSIESFDAAGVSLARSETSYEDDALRMIQVDPRGIEYVSQYDSRERFITHTIRDASLQADYGVAEIVLESLSYDGQDNVVESKDSRGTVTRYQYDGADRMIARIDAAGSTIAETTRFTYDAADNLLSVTDARGSVTRYGYDTVYRNTSVTDANGDTYQTTYDRRGLPFSTLDPLGRADTFTYDALGRMTREIDPDGFAIENEFDLNANRIRLVDKLGRESLFTYDERNFPVSFTDPDGSVVDREYDAVGNLISETDELNRTTRFVYDGLDRQIESTDAIGAFRTFVYDASSNLISVTDPIGRTATTTYDAFNRVREFIDPLGNTTRTIYDPAGLPIEQIDPIGRSTRSVYDQLRRPVTTFDGDSQPTAYTYLPTGLVESVSDPLGNLLRYQYDAVGRLTAQIDPLARASTIVYDAVGNAIERTTPLGHQQQFEYDNLDRLIRSTDAEGRVSELEYDAIGNRTLQRDPEGFETLFEYDDLNRLITETDPQGRSRRMEYDAVSNLVATIDRNERRIETTYDEVDRAIEELWIDAGNQTIRTFTNTYDLAGQLTGVSDNDSTLTFDYDLAGRLRRETSLGLSGATAVTLEYQYDRASQRTQRNHLVGSINRRSDTFDYDTVGRQTFASMEAVGQSEVIAQFSYDVANRMTGLSRSIVPSGGSLSQPGPETIYSFDAATQLTSIDHQVSSVSIARYDYDFDLDSRITEVTSPDGISLYSYDRTDQLTSATHDFMPDESYQFDDRGNRTGTDFVVDSDNRLTSDPSFDFEYDDEGNLLSRTERSTGTVTRFVYDYRNRITSASIEDVAGNITYRADYRFDPFDRRVEIVEDVDGDGNQPATTTHFVYDGTRLLVEQDASGAVMTQYLHGPMTNQIVAAQDGAGTVVWALPDHLRSIRDWVDGSGTSVVHSVFNSFGVDVSSTGSIAAPRFGYAGYQYDAALSQYHVNARSYDPATGRFLSQDPIRQAAGDANLYRYVGNRVTGSYDPTGLEEEGIINKVIKTAKQAGVEYLQGQVNMAKAILDVAPTITGFVAEGTSYAADYYGQKATGNPLDTLAGGAVGIVEGVVKAIHVTVEGTRDLIVNAPEVAEAAVKGLRFVIQNPKEAALKVGESVERAIDSAKSEWNEVVQLSEQGKLYDAARKIGNVAGTVIGELIPLDRVLKGAKAAKTFLGDLKIKGKRKRLNERPPIDRELSTAESVDVPSRDSSLHDRLNNRPDIVDRDDILRDRLNDRPPIGDDLMRDRFNQRPKIEPDIDPSSGNSITRNQWTDTDIVGTKRPGVDSKFDTQMPDTHIPDTHISDTLIRSNKVPRRTDGASNFNRPADPTSPIKRKMCFVAGTMVATEHGQRPIETIKAGELVYTFDFENGEWVLRPVTETHVSEYEGALVTIKTDQGEVTATAYHPFWVVEGHDLENRPRPKGLKDDEDEGLSLKGRWVNSHDLFAGDVVYRRAEGGIIATEVRQSFHRSVRVHNLSVYRMPSFFTGPNSLLVHNTPGCEATSGNAGAKTASNVQRRVTTIDEILSSNIIPGKHGVVLDQGTVLFDDLWRLSLRDGTEFLLTRENGQKILRSGTRDSVTAPAGVRPIAHTHPPDAADFVDEMPSRADINALNLAWSTHPNRPRPVSQIIVGFGETISFRATGFQTLSKPKKR